MIERKKTTVFFDCWDTLVAFATKEEAWETRPLINHLTNKEVVNIEEVQKYGHQMLDIYYHKHLPYEISALQFCKLLVLRFGLKLDCSLEQCAYEMFVSLNPSPIPGADGFLSVLEENHIPYACLSNTIYPKKSMEKLLTSFYPKHRFAILLTSEEVGVKKPNPDFFALGSILLHVPLSDSIYIGDSYLQDICGSYLAGYGLSIFFNRKKKTWEDLSFVKDFVEDYRNIPHKTITSYAELYNSKGELSLWKN